MKIVNFAACVSLVVLAATSPAFADCTSPVGPAGLVVYNDGVNAMQYCNGTNWVAMGAINPAAGSGTCANPAAPERTMIYNEDYSVMQFCNGQDWIAIGPYPVPTGTLIGPSDCANIGDLCADGTVFAGYHPITQAHLFIPTTNQGMTEWKTSTGTDDIATDYDSDGAANAAQVPNSATFPAFKLCKDLAIGGYSDWYLPSRVELYYIWSVRGTIEATGNITNFSNANYWSSTEDSTNIAWSQIFTNGFQSDNTKTSAYRVRCVRQ